MYSGFEWQPPQVAGMLAGYTGEPACRPGRMPWTPWQFVQVGAFSAPGRGGAGAGATESGNLPPRRSAAIAPLRLHRGRLRVVRISTMTIGTRQPALRV